MGPRSCTDFPYLERVYRAQGASLSSNRRRGHPSHQGKGRRRKRQMQMKASLTLTGKRVVCMVGFLCGIREEVTWWDEELEKGVSVWISVWHGGGKLLGRCRRSPSSTEALAFLIRSKWGRRIEHHEERIMKEVFNVEKEKELQGPQADWEAVTWPVDWRSPLNIHWQYENQRYTPWSLKMVKEQDRMVRLQREKKSKLPDVLIFMMAKVNEQGTFILKRTRVLGLLHLWFSNYNMHVGH